MTNLSGFVDLVRVHCYDQIAGWSSQVARWAHNPKVASSNLAPATNSLDSIAGHKVWQHRIWHHHPAFRYLRCLATARISAICRRGGANRLFRLQEKDPVLV